jgi:hypothetical protein
MAGALTGLELQGRLGDPAQGRPAARDRDRHVRVEELEDFRHHVRVAPAQDRVGRLRPVDPRLPGRRAGEPHARFGQPEPPVGSFRDPRPEPERVRQVQLRPGEAGHHVPG